MMKPELTNKEDDQLFDLLQNYLNNISPKERRLIKAEITVLISNAMQRAVEEAYPIYAGQDPADDIRLLQSQVESLRAEVERLKECEVIVRVLASGRRNMYQARQWVKDNTTKTE